MSSEPESAYTIEARGGMLALVFVRSGVVVNTFRDAEELAADVAWYQEDLNERRAALENWKARNP